MRTIEIIVFLFFGISFSASAQAPASPTAALSAIELVKKVETQYQGNTSHGRMQMSIKNRNWSRTLVIESWSEGRDKMLTKFSLPPKNVAPAP